MPGNWVDFAAVKRQVPITAVLERYQVNWLQGKGGELRGRCPLSPHVWSAARKSTQIPGGGMWQHPEAGCSTTGRERPGEDHAAPDARQRRETGAVSSRDDEGR